MLDYERITARDLKRIVNRGEATPAAIGLFVVYDFWEREHGRRSIVDNKLLRYIVGKWAYSASANELEFWLELGGQLRILELQAIEQANKAHISLLQAEKIIARAASAFYAGWSETLYDQALKYGLEITEPPGGIARAREAAQDIPSEEEIDDTAESIRTYVAQFLGYLPVMGAAGALLGIPLTHEIRESGVVLAPWAEKQEARLEEYGELVEHWPDMVKSLKRLTAVGSVRPSPATMSYVDKVIGAYLSPNWREWAGKEINLREQADRSRGVVDLIRHAELAAAELTNE